MVEERALVSVEEDEEKEAEVAKGTGGIMDDGDKSLY